MKSGQLATVSFLRCALCAGALSCWKMNAVGSWRLLEKNDNLEIIYKQNKLLFVKASL